MTYTSYPFDNQDTTEAQYSALFAELQDSGVIGSYGSTALQVTAASTGMTVSLAPGAAIVRGFYFNNDSSATLTISAATSSQRYDAVILRLDPSSNSILPVVVANAGLVPTLTQTASGIYEILLAVVTVPSSAVTIASTNVADKRRYVGNRMQVMDSTNRPSAPRAYQTAITPDQGGRLAVYNPTSGWQNSTSVFWGNLTTFPTTGVAIGDTMYHTAWKSMMVYATGNVWRQMDGPAPWTSADLTYAYNNPSFTAGMPVGFLVRSPDSNNGLATLSWRGNTQRAAGQSDWMFVGGPDQPVLFSPNSGSSGWISHNGQYQYALSYNLPLHVAGTLYVRFHGSWLCAQNGAILSVLTFGPQVWQSTANTGGSVAIPGSIDRTHNAGAGNIPINFGMEGRISTTGAPGVVTVLLAPDANGQDVYVFLSNLEAWVTAS